MNGLNIKDNNRINRKPFEKRGKATLAIYLEKGNMPKYIKYNGDLYQIKKLGSVEEESYVPDSKFYKLISKINKKIIEKAGVSFFIKLTRINSKLDILSAKLFLLETSIGIGIGSFIFGSATYFLYNGKSPEQYKEFLGNIFPGISIKPGYVIGGIMLLYSYRKIKETVDLVQRVMINDVEEELKKRYPDKKLKIMEIISRFKKADEEERTANKGSEIILNLALSFLGPFKGFITPIVMAIIGAKNNIKYEKKQMKNVEELESILKEQ